MEGKNLIGGKWEESNNKLTSINPANEEVIGKDPNIDEKDVKKAVYAAKKAFIEWKKVNLWERAEILKKAAAEILKKSEELKRLITIEMGKPLKESDIEVLETSDMINFFANEGKSYFEGETIPINPAIFPNKFSYTIHEPIGVIGVIKPWNYPLELPFWSIAPALLAGNTVVFKPSELTPFVGIEIGKILETAGVPDGVFNLITGDKTTGELLVKSDLDMISFTGSVEVGKKVMKNSSEKLHRISLELGGSDPFIVCEDVDLEEVINGAVWGRFTNCGQVCVSAKRIFVVEEVADEFIEGMVAKTKELIVGDGLDENTDLGPLVSEYQRIKIEDQVQDAIKKGAKLLCGGKIPDNLDKGYFYLPTVLTELKPDMKVMTEEVFGPIAAINVVKDADEALALANNSIYGLGASIWTKDLHKATHLAHQLDAGMVWVNEINVAYPQCPWGGIKKSGMGKELSKHGILEYTNLKHVNIDYGLEKTRPWWFPYKNSGGT